ncbi:MAG TPA: COX15/CtaA family protein [Bacteroidia bacterium]|nr:COX15/CtaA family protein [Bacteroidia bacterium]HNT80034.1 COX15/CtaA family protein [Bacteroidia bacterium]
MTNELNIKTNTWVIAWLFTGCLLVFLMVFVGGITRLTGSGLSITKWDLITGTVPPLNETDWNQQFDLYKQSPQYQKTNYHFTLEDFKQIYWWEYIHRLIGRSIGIIFLIPFLFFYFKKMLHAKLVKQLLFVFALGALQGLAGWLMVASGLIDNPRVSHYRLAIHLMLAFITCAYIFHIALQETYSQQKIKNDPSLNRKRQWAVISFVVVFIQIVFGAFVAGLKAGYIYNTWPMMGEEWIAAAVTAGYKNYGLMAFFDLPSNVQFVHRTLAFVSLISISVLFSNLQKSSDQKLKTASHFLLWITIIQIIAGILTLLYSVPVWLGIAHQAIAFLLFMALIFILHRLYINHSKSIT